jgi:glycosyl transferase family 25
MQNKYEIGTLSITAPTYFPKVSTVRSMRQSPQLPIFVINLDRSPARLDAFRDQMEKLGLTFERVAAIDGSDLSHEGYYRYFNDPNTLLSLGMGQIGCFLSHRKAWSIMLERGLDWVFIGEDDIHVSDSFRRFFFGLNWAPHDASLIKAETHRQRVVLGPRLGETAGQHSLRQLKSSHLGTGGYFINASAAEFLLRATKCVIGPIDQVLFDPKFDLFQKMAVYQIDPAICVQDFLLWKTDKKHNFDSTLQTERDELIQKNSYHTKIKGWGKLMREVRRAQNRVKISLSRNTIKRVTFAGDQL